MVASTIVYATCSFVAGFLFTLARVSLYDNGQEADIPTLALPFAAPQPLKSLQYWNPTLFESICYVQLELSVCIIMLYLHLAFIFGVTGMVLTLLDGMRVLLEMLDENEPDRDPRILPPLGRDDDEEDDDDSFVGEEEGE